MQMEAAGVEDGLNRKPGGLCALPARISVAVLWKTHNLPIRAGAFRIPIALVNSPSWHFLPLHTLKEAP